MKTEHQQAFDKLNEALTAMGLTGDDREQFAAIWQPYTVKRKEVLTRAGDTEKYLYFVVDGVQRIYYFDEQEREATILFTYSPSFGGVLDSYMLQKPSVFYYEALTPSVFLRVPHAALQKLLQTNPAIEVMVRDSITASLSGILHRLVELQCFSSEEKFRKLLHRSPHILQLVPHKYLANYLGIDATNFSKLINRVKI